MQLTSPMSRGHFQRLTESPGTPSARQWAGRVRDLASVEATALAWTEAQGIEGDDAAAVAALRALPAETLNDGMDATVVSMVIFEGGPLLGVSNAIVDGKLVVKHPELALMNNEWAQVPVLARCDACCREPICL